MMMRVCFLLLVGVVSIDGTPHLDPCGEVDDDESVFCQLMEPPNWTQVYPCGEVDDDESVVCVSCWSCVN
jgi:hypothetical protein